MHSKPRKQIISSSINYKLNNKIEFRFQIYT
jgi:hypothetical protein